MDRITYKDIFNIIKNKFKIDIILENISNNKMMLKFKSKKYKHIWFDCDEFCNEKNDKIYIKYNNMESINDMIYDVLFDHIKIYEKYYLMVNDENGDKLLFKIPQFNSEEELALKMELVG